MQGILIKSERVKLIGNIFNNKPIVSRNPYLYGTVNVNAHLRILLVHICVMVKNQSHG